MTDTPKITPNANNDTAPVKIETPAVARPAAVEIKPDAKPEADKK